VEPVERTGGAKRLHQSGRRYRGRHGVSFCRRDLP
jgi:hypothetical protein